MRGEPIILWASPVFVFFSLNLFLILHACISIASIPAHCGLINPFFSATDEYTNAINVIAKF